MRYLPTAAEPLAQSSSTASVDTSYSLFVRPEIDILENDFLVISRLGKVIEALAGAADGAGPTISSVRTVDPWSLSTDTL